MVLPKSVGGLRVRDLPIVTNASNIKRAVRFWGRSYYILVKWMLKRYIRGFSLKNMKIYLYKKLYELIKGFKVVL